MKNSAITRIVNQMSIKYKLFFILLLISIIPLILVSYASISYMTSSSNSYSTNLSRQHISFVSNDLNSYFTQMQFSFEGLVNHTSFQRFTGTDRQDLAQQSSDIIEFRSLISNAMQFYPEILGVLYLDKQNKTYFQTNQKTLDASFNFKADTLYSSIYQLESNQLLPPHPMNYVLYAKDSIFSYVWPIVNLHNGDITSWLMIEIKAEKIFNILENEHGQAGQLYLYYKPAQRLYQSSELDVEAQLAERFKQAYAEQDNKQQTFYFTSQNQTYEASISSLFDENWELVWIANRADIKQGVAKAIQATMIIAFVSLVLAVIIAFPSMNTVVKPLSRLKKGMEKLSRGIYTPIANTARSDEIGYLVHSYNRTIHKLEEMEQQVYRAQLREKEHEILQLQAQINPHFVFNTLETIDSYAARNNGDAVSDMVLSLSRMMRHTVSNNSSWTTLREEVDYIRHFMNIHYYRHHQHVNAELDIDDQVLEERIMKMSIQPYIENSFKYAWTPSMTPEQFKLTVRAQKLGDKLKIEIKDTGIGMPEAIMQHMQQLIEAKGELQNEYFNKHTGIYNAYRRFVLTYGAEGEFILESSPEQGTQIILIMPLQLP